MGKFGVFLNEGGGGGGNLGYLKKRGAQLSVSGSTGRQCGPPQHIKQNLKHLAK